MRFLVVARMFYALVGLGTLLMTAGLVSSYLGPGAAVELRAPIVGVLVGVLSIAAAVLVSGRPTAGMTRHILAWAGIAAGIAPFLWLLALGITSATSALGVTLVPLVVALPAAVVMARAMRLREVGSSTPP
jgi:hypothetical protein